MKKRAVISPYGSSELSKRFLITLPSSFEDLKTIGNKKFSFETTLILDSKYKTIDNLDKINDREFIYFLDEDRERGFHKRKRSNENTETQPKRFKGLENIPGFTNLKEIHKGNNSFVFEAFSKQRKETEIIKYIADEDEADLEIDMLHLLCGKNHTIPLLETITCVDSSQVLVFPKFELSADKFIPQSKKEVQTFMFQLLQAVEYCHSLNVMHRDIKPSNILVQRTPQLKVVLADFGLAQKYVKGQDSERCGTKYYMAPEILANKAQYDLSVDMWSVGMVFITLLTGKPLLTGFEQTELIQKKIGTTIEHPSFPQIEEFSELNEIEKAFLSCLLKINPQERISAKSALQHQYFNKL